MKINTAKDASRLWSDLNKLRRIKRHTEEENNHWWSFLTPNMRSFDKEGLEMPEVLREEFTKAVDRSIERLEKHIDEL